MKIIGRGRGHNYGPDNLAKEFSSYEQIYAKCSPKYNTKVTDLLCYFFLKYKDVNYQNSRDEIFLVFASVRIS